MSEIPQSKVEGVAPLGDTLAGIAAAALAGSGVSLLASAFGGSVEAIGNLDLAVFCAVLFADPLGALRDRATWGAVGAKMGAGALVGLAVAMVISLSMGPFGGQAVSASAAVAPQIWVGLLGFVILPMVFMTPLVEQILTGRARDGRPVTAADLTRALILPVRLGLFLSLTLGVAAVLWWISAPFWCGIAILALGVLLTVSEVIEGRPRAAGDPARVWPLARQALRLSWPAALFNGGTVYAVFACVAFILPPSLGPVVGIGAALSALFLVAGVTIVLGIGLMLFGVLLMLAIVALIGRLQNSAPMRTVDLANAALSRLFLGRSLGAGAAVRHD